MGGALDGVVAALIAGVTEAFHARIDGMVSDVVTSIRKESRSASNGSAGKDSGSFRDD